MSDPLDDGISIPKSPRELAARAADRAVLERAGLLTFGRDPEPAPCPVRKPHWSVPQ